MLCKLLVTQVCPAGFVVAANSMYYDFRTCTFTILSVFIGSEVHRKHTHPG